MDSLSPLSNSLLCIYSFIADITIPNDTTELVACSLNVATFFYLWFNHQKQQYPSYSKRVCGRKVIQYSKVRAAYMSDHQFSLSIPH